jgi:hypothetical protein
MNVSMRKRLRTFAIGTTLFSISLAGIARAERVGYQFKGQLRLPPALPNSTAPDMYTLFKVNVPTDAPIAGTFSYDTTFAGSNGSNGGLVFTEGIEGGLTFDVLGSNGAPLMHLVVSQYTITVNNDFLPQDTPSPIDLLKVDLIPPPAPITANGASVTSVTSTLAIPFNWDPQTFPAPDLWTDLPPISFKTIGTIGTITRNPTLAAFDIKSLERISPPTGDYNVDGRVDVSDYVEWRKAFGYTDPAHHYADGNHNGVVDDADYVAWRNALSLSNAGATSVPEPPVEWLAAVASLVIASFPRRRA